MQITITSVDYAPPELEKQTPIAVELLREIPGDDRPDYWLGIAAFPILWIADNMEREITHVILAARWQGTRIEPGIEHLPIGIAYVTDRSLLNDEKLSFKKCKYVAIGIAHDSSDADR